MRIVPPSLIAGFVVVALGACGGSSKPAATGAPTSTAAAASSTSSTAAPASAPDPCTLMTQAEATALAETPVGAAVKSGTADDMLCQYNSPPTGPTAQVEVFVGAGVKKSLDIDRGLQHTFTTLSGIGDEAYIEDSNVFVRKGDLWAQVNTVILDADSTKVQAGLVSAARTIATRL